MIAGDIYDMEIPRRTELLRIAQLTAGILLILVGGLLGPIPGPLGLPVALFGLVLVLRSSRWAKRKYAWAKHRWPRWFSVPDRLLRRKRPPRAA